MGGRGGATEEMKAREAEIPPPGNPRLTDAERAVKLLFRRRLPAHHFVDPDWGEGCGASFGNGIVAIDA